MTPHRLCLLIGIVLLAPVFACQLWKPFGPGPRNKEEADDLKQLMEDEYKTDASDLAEITFNQNAYNSMAEGAITRDLRSAMRDHLKYNDLVSDHDKCRDKVIKVFGYAVRVRPRTYNDTQGIEAFVAVEDPSGSGKPSHEPRYVLALCNRDSTVHTGDLCEVVGIVGDKFFTLHGHPVMPCIASAVLTPAEAARYVVMAASPAAPSPSTPQPNTSATPASGSLEGSIDFVRPLISRLNEPLVEEGTESELTDDEISIFMALKQSGGAGRDALLRNGEDGLRRHIGPDELMADKERPLDPIYLKAEFAPSNVVTGGYGQAYEQIALVTTDSPRRGVLVFCLREPPFMTYPAHGIIVGYMSNRKVALQLAQGKKALMPVIIARALLPE